MCGGPFSFLHGGRHAKANRSSSQWHAMPPATQSPRSPSLHHETTTSDPTGGPGPGEGTEEAGGGLEKRLT